MQRKKGNFPAFKKRKCGWKKSRASRSGGTKCLPGKLPRQESHSEEHRPARKGWGTGHSPADTREGVLLGSEGDLKQKRKGEKGFYCDDKEPGASEAGGEGGRREGGGRGEKKARAKWKGADLVRLSFLIRFGGEKKGAG